jgi:hypothetical protein
MKLPRIAVCIAGIVTLGVSAPALSADAHDHGHHHHDAAPAKLELDHGKKWKTDEPLRQSMANMRGAIAERLHEIHSGRLSQEQYAALGKTIESQVGAIVAECKLEPKADAMLHIVVADLLGAADVMQGKAQGKPAEAAHRAAMALNSYGRYFNHPKWAALK